MTMGSTSFCAATWLTKSEVLATKAAAADAMPKPLILGPVDGLRCYAPRIYTMAFGAKGD